MSEKITCNPSACNSKPEQSVEIPKRRKSIPAPRKQLVAFSVAEDWKRFLGKYPEDAENERAYLEAKIGKPMKVIMVPQFTIDDLINKRVVIIKDGKIFEVPVKGDKA
jgi:hypothetical protein